MNDRFERELAQLIRTFVADVTTLAERAAVDGIHAAFVRASSQLGLRAVRGPRDADDRRKRRDAVPAVAAAGDKPPRSARVRPRWPLTPDGLDALRARAVALVREQPGWTTAQLGETLVTPPGKLRVLLQELADAGSLRIEEGLTGGMKRPPTYFPLEHLSGHGEDAPASARGVA